MKALGNFIFLIVVLVIVSSLVDETWAAAIVSGGSGAASAAGSRSTRNGNEEGRFWAARGKRNLLCKNCEEEPELAQQPQGGQGQDFDELQPQLQSQSQSQPAMKYFSQPNPLFSNPKPFQRFRLLANPLAWTYYDEPSASMESGTVPEPSYLQRQQQLHYAYAPSAAVMNTPYSYALYQNYKPLAIKKQDTRVNDKEAPFYGSRG